MDVLNIFISLFIKYFIIYILINLLAKEDLLGKFSVIILFHYHPNVLLLTLSNIHLI